MSNFPKTLSEIRYHEHFFDESFISFWSYSLDRTRSILGGVLSLVTSFLASFIIGVIPAIPRKDLLLFLSDVNITYTITVLGFMLVSITLLLNNNDPRQAYEKFTRIDNEYKLPMLKVFAMHFLLPAGIVALLLLVAVGSKFAVLSFSNLVVSNNLRMCAWIVAMTLLGGLFLFSLREIVINYWNIYRFMIVSTYGQSSAYEIEVLRKYYDGKNTPEIYERNEVDEIVTNVRSQVENPTEQS